MNPTSLAIRNLTAYTERQGIRHALLSDVSLEIKAGEVLALIGPSGSGKSLTCNASLGLLPPGVRRASGSVEVDGLRQPSESLRGRVVATIMQNPRSAFNPVRTMRQHAFETFRALSIPKPEWLPRIEQAMQEAGLEEVSGVLQLHAFEMSGGMLQRMMIALALASEAPFLFADEPTTDLDLIVQREILDLLDHLRAERGLGLLLVTHDMGVVATVADSVAVMDAGRIVERGSAMEIFHHPKSDQAKQLVDAHLSLYRLDRAA